MEEVTKRHIIDFCEKYKIEVHGDLKLKYGWSFFLPDYERVEQEDKSIYDLLKANYCNGPHKGRYLAQNLNPCSLRI